jgi:hypothetical protein
LAFQFNVKFNFLPIKVRVGERSQNSRLNWSVVPYSLLSRAPWLMPENPFNSFPIIVFKFLFLIIKRTYMNKFYIIFYCFIFFILYSNILYNTYFIIFYFNSFLLCFTVLGFSLKGWAFIYMKQRK